MRDYFRGGTGFNRQMIDDHLTNLADIDVVRLDNGDMKWINYDSSVDLNDFEKVHSGGSSDSYILRSLADPNLYRGVRREDFFKSLLSKRTDKSGPRHTTLSTKVSLSTEL